VAERQVQEGPHDRSRRDDGHERSQPTAGARLQAHTVVDDKVGVILEVKVTTGQTNEGEMIEPQVDEVKVPTGIAIKTVTADAGYSYAKVYGALEQRGIEALIPAKAEPIRSRVHCAVSGTMPSTIFSSARQDAPCVVMCDALSDRLVVPQ